MRKRGVVLSRTLGMAVVVAAVALLGAAPATATQTQRWRVDTVDELLGGQGNGVAVTADGRLVAVPGWSPGPTFEEAVVMAGARAGDGELLVATGYPARLYRVTGSKAELLAELEGEQATAVLSLEDGSAIVATVFPGVLYRWRRGRLEEVGRLGEGGLWDLTLYQGRVVAAGGPPASLYRLGEHGLERWAELPDAHARCLEASSDRLLVGTSGHGMVFAVWPGGEVSLVTDSPFTEITDLAAAPDGSVWAVALVGEPTKPAPSETNGSSTDASPAVNLDLPKLNGQTATSEVLRLTPEGALLKVHRFTKQVASSVAVDGDGVLVGTGLEGEVWRFVADGGTRLATVDAIQVMAILDGGGALLTQGPGRVLWRRQAGEMARFRSAAKRFERPVRFGEFVLDPPQQGLRIRFRSGVSEKPDETWLPWTGWLADARGTVVPLPPASSLQWEVELGDEAVERVEVAYREVNLAPKLTAVDVEDPGVVYLSAPPPSGPVIDVAHPDFSGIFTVLDPAGGNDKPKQGKKYYRAGFRTVSWKGEDPNGDPLRYELQLEHRAGFRLPIREHLDTTQVAFDTSAVPDGVYRVLVEVSDELGNPEAPRQANAVTRWFVVDNSPPQVTVERDEDQWRVEVEDAHSPLVRVEWSRDGERWNGLAPVDGVLDGRRESFSVPARQGVHLVVVRVIDRQHNRTVTGVMEE